MTTTRKGYQHFCPAARALEVIGEKWSLLVVRDLLAGPQRFTDLMQYLGGITPKWLTVRLRELEEAGIVERDQTPGRREVWYRLTPKGRDLAPVIDGLFTWGLEHAMHAPEPDEPAHPGQMTSAVAVYLTKRGTRLPGPRTWLLRLPSDRAYTIRFDGTAWSVTRGAPAEDATPDLIIRTEADVWTTFLAATVAERDRLFATMQITGIPEHIAELRTTFGWRRRALRALRDVPAPASEISAARA